MRQKIHVIGAGPGHASFIHERARQIIESCDMLIGASRILAGFSGQDFELVRYTSGRLDLVLDAISENPDKRIAVLVTGDTGLFSMASYLKKNLPDADVTFIPGISSLSYLCARLGASYADMPAVSVHAGGDLDELLLKIRANRKIAVFVGKQPPQEICQELDIRGAGDLPVIIGENLSLDDERIYEGTVKHAATLEFANLAVMIIYNTSYKGHAAPRFGIPDEQFIRDAAPMTKSEVRAVIASKLCIQPGDDVADIGAGSGSVSVECALAAYPGVVYAVEKESLARDLIRRNARALNAPNVVVIEGEAPRALDDLMPPRRVFIGGSGGQLEGIIAWAARAEQTTVCVSAICVETVNEAIRCLGAYGFGEPDIACVQVSKARRTSKGHMMMGQNPVYIITAEK